MTIPEGHECDVAHLSMANMFGPVDRILSGALLTRLKRN